MAYCQSIHVVELCKKYSNWRVHSTFANGVNISNGKDLIFIGNDQNGLLPFGVVLTKQTQNLLKNKWKQEDKIKIFNESIININRQITILLHPRYKYSCILKKPKTFKIQLVHKFIEQACKLKGKNGFELTIEESIKINEEFTFYGKVLINALFSSDQKEIDSIIKYFIGRGKGLTPSGDDLLVGLLSIGSAFLKVSPYFVESLSNMIENENLTTDISKGYLRYALCGKFEHSILTIIDNLCEENDSLEEVLSSILRHGHTSGMDLLTGILLGLMRVKEIK
ncbi:DUF2877 domain-containing protein [Inediibacterium massiliense]|uniref:DUF2877 domain-containing protein n=1 Tax=Inediibacterium massiliense TaxID=1658111 RepID=UPI0006B661EC|nr:DUF2877 domain-containing protein [Inediibacterium massiliense]